MQWRKGFQVIMAVLIFWYLWYLSVVLVFNFNFTGLIDWHSMFHGWTDSLNLVIFVWDFFAAGNRPQLLPTAALGPATTAAGCSSARPNATVPLRSTLDPGLKKNAFRFFDSLEVLFYGPNYNYHGSFRIWNLLLRLLKVVKFFTLKTSSLLLWCSIYAEARQCFEVR